MHFYSLKMKRYSSVRENSIVLTKNSYRNINTNANHTAIANRYKPNIINNCSIVTPPSIKTSTDDESNSYNPVKTNNEPGANDLNPTSLSAQHVCHPTSGKNYLINRLYYNLSSLNYGGDKNKIRSLSSVINHYYDDSVSTNGSHGASMMPKSRSNTSNISHKDKQTESVKLKKIELLFSKKLKLTHSASSQLTRDLAGSNGNIRNNRKLFCSAFFNSNNNRDSDPLSSIVYV